MVAIQEATDKWQWYEDDARTLIRCREVSSSNMGHSGNLDARLSYQERRGGSCGCVEQTARRGHTNDGSSDRRGADSHKNFANKSQGRRKKRMPSVEGGCKLNAVNYKLCAKTEGTLGTEKDQMNVPADPILRLKWRSNIMNKGMQDMERSSNAATMNKA